MSIIVDYNLGSPTAHPPAGCSMTQHKTASAFKSIWTSQLFQQWLKLLERPEAEAEWGTTGDLICLIKRSHSSMVEPQLTPISQKITVPGATAWPHNRLWRRVLYHRQCLEPHNPRQLSFTASHEKNGLETLQRSAVNDMEGRKRDYAPKTRQPSITTREVPSSRQYPWPVTAHANLMRDYHSIPEPRKAAYGHGQLKRQISRLNDCGKPSWLARTLAFLSEYSLWKSHFNGSQRRNASSLDEYSGNRRLPSLW